MSLKTVQLSSTFSEHKTLATRHLSYCFYIAVDQICVAISRVDGALKPWLAIHLGVGNSKQKLAYLDLPVPVI